MNKAAALMARRRSCLAFLESMLFPSDAFTFQLGGVVVDRFNTHRVGFAGTLRPDGDHVARLKTRDQHAALGPISNGSGSLAIDGFV